MLLSDYDDRHFLKEDGTYDLTTNVEVITRLTVERYHLQLNGEKTMFGENMVFLPFDYLCAKSLETREILRSENTFTIHHFAGSWLPEEVREWTNLRQQYVQQYMEKSKWIILKLAAIKATNDLYGKREVMRRIGKRFPKTSGEKEIDMKTLSIIIPIYNTHGKYFSKCLASLQCQEMDELEVIAVDDGSLERNSNEIKAQIEKSPLTIQYYKKRKWWTEFSTRVWFDKGCGSVRFLYGCR